MYKFFLRKTVQEGMGKPSVLEKQGVFLILPNSELIKIFIIYHLAIKDNLIERRKNRTDKWYSIN
jgi:hypothetical protein